MFPNCSSRPNSGPQKRISYKCWFSIIYCVSKGSYGIKSYLFAAFLYSHNGWFVRSSLEVKPFIIGDIWRLKGPYISNFCIIVDQVLYLEENYSLPFSLSVWEKNKNKNDSVVWTHWKTWKLKLILVFYYNLHSSLKLLVRQIMIDYMRKKKTSQEIIYSFVFAVSSIWETEPL